MVVTGFRLGTTMPTFLVSVGTMIPEYYWSCDGPSTVVHGDCVCCDGAVVIPLALLWVLIL